MQIAFSSTMLRYFVTTPGFPVIFLKCLNIFYTNKLNQISLKADSHLPKKIFLFASMKTL